MGRVWDHSSASGSALLILLKLADLADDEGVTGRYGPATNAVLEQASRANRATVQRNLRRLEQTDPPELLVLERGTGRRATQYQVVVGLPRERWQGELEGPQNAAPGPSENAAPGAAESTGQGPSAAAPGAAPARPVDVEDVSAKADAVTDDSRVAPASARGELDPGARRVAKSGVTPDEWITAGLLLDEFNQWAGTSYSLTAHYAPIVGRLREHPGLSVDEHRQVIEAAFLRPWWHDAPAPTVVYGNAAQFERCIAQWQTGGRPHARAAAPANGNGRPLVAHPDSPHELDAVLRAAVQVDQRSGELSEVHAWVLTEHVHVHGERNGRLVVAHSRGAGHDVGRLQPWIESALGSPIEPVQCELQGPT